MMLHVHEPGDNRGADAAAILRLVKILAQGRVDIQLSLLSVALAVTCTANGIGKDEAMSTFAKVMGEVEALANQAAAASQGEWPASERGSKDHG